MLATIAITLLTLVTAQSVVETSSPKACAEECLRYGYEFCTRTNLEAGFCCTAERGCPSDLREATAFCSYDVASHLAAFTCPTDTRCGPSRVVEAESDWHRLYVDQRDMRSGDTCIYQIAALDPKDEDLIELDAIQIENAELAIYYGKDSLYKRASKTKLMVLDGRENQAFPSDQPLYLVADFTQDGASGFFLEYRKLGKLAAEPSPKPTEAEDAGSLGEEGLFYALSLAATFLLMASICLAYVALKVQTERRRNLEQVKISPSLELGPAGCAGGTAETEASLGRDGAWRAHSEDPHEKSQAAQFEELQRAWEKLNRRQKPGKGVKMIDQVILEDEAEDATTPYGSLKAAGRRGTRTADGELRTQPGTEAAEDKYELPLDDEPLGSERGLLHTSRENMRALDAIVEEFGDTSTQAGAHGCHAGRSDARPAHGASYPGSP